MISFVDISASIQQLAREAGFDLCGVAPVREFGELRVFPEWIAKNHHGEMKYMESRNEAGDLKRASLANAAPWARSVVVCAINYNTAQPYSTQVSSSEAAGKGWISRYAWSREDYHDAVMRRLRVLEGRLHELCDQSCEQEPEIRDLRPRTQGLTGRKNRSGAEELAQGLKPELGQIGVRGPEGPLFHGSAGTPDSFSLLKPDAQDLTPELLTRSYVDTGPFMERVYAKYAGIGWIGKNTCVINQKLGSWLFLGVILTSLEIPAEAAILPAPDRCGTCTRCIAACPTQAIVAPGELDARLCISYLTIEKRGDIPQAEGKDLRAGLGRHVFGCDICQDVCPWNRKAPVTTAEEFQPREGLVNPPLEWLAEMQPEEFREIFRGSPVRRAKLTGLRRNAAIAMGNGGNKKFAPTLKRLAEDADSMVVKHAKWALERIMSAG